MSGNVFGKRLALVVKATSDNQLTAAMVEIAEGLGWGVMCVEDGDERGMNADVLLMYGHGRMFVEYAKKLRRARRRGQRGPRAVLWQFDPYPPPQEARGGGGWMRCADGLAWRMEAMGLGRGVVRAVSKVMLKRAVKAMGSGAKGAMSEIDHRMLRYTMECERWVRRGVGQGWLDEVFVSTMQKREHLKRLGIEARFAPVGYAKYMGEDMGRERDIDVVFLGTVKHGLHRARVLERLAGECEQAGLVMRVVSGGCYGGERMELLNRAKMVLHLHQYPWDTPWIRLFLATANGAMMVSERLSDARPMEVGRDLETVEEGDLVKVIGYYAKHEQERRRIVERMREKMMERMTLEGSVRRILEGD